MATEKNIARVGAVIVAAGGSSRLGRPKQLLSYNGKTLLQHTIDVALAANVQPVVVVLGASAEALQNDVANNAIHVVLNKEWKEGMAASIRCGVKAFADLNPTAEGFILMVCDQPFVTSALLSDLIAAHEKSGKPIVASEYDSTFGPPSFFHHSVFAELMQLKGDVGARAIVKQHADAVEVIPFAAGNFDVDTEADYERLKTAGRP